MLETTCVEATGMVLLLGRFGDENIDSRTLLGLCHFDPKPSSITRTFRSRKPRTRHSTAADLCSSFWDDVYQNCDFQVGPFQVGEQTPLF